MAIELIQLQSSAIEELSAFLKKHFKLPDAAQFGPEMLAWKYFDARPDWDGPRAYVLKSGAKWLAHAGVCPMVFERGSQKIRGILLVDWVSASPGAGAEIFRRFYPMIDVLFGNGGSPGARATFQTLEYPTRGAVEYYTYPLKPLELFHEQSARGFGGAAARLVRNLVSAATPAPSPGRGWSARRVEGFTPFHADLWEGHGLPFLQTDRSVPLVDYYLCCPLAQVSAYEVRQDSKLRGCFLLAQTGSEIRLVDARLPSDDTRDWSMLVTLAKQCASETSASFMTASASMPLLNGAIRANRFRWFQSDPVYLYDPKGFIKPTDKLHIVPFDGDQAYL